MALTLTFTGYEHFAALRQAEAYLKARGFSIGPTSVHDPVPVMFGDVQIAKYRNLDREERADLHGLITGDHRQGPVTIVIRATAPAEVAEAFNREVV